MYQARREARKRMKRRKSRDPKETAMDGNLINLPDYAVAVGGCKHARGHLKIFK